VSVTNRITPDVWIDEHVTNIDSCSTIGGGSRIYAGVTMIKSSVGRWTDVGPRSLVHHADVGNFCSISWTCSLGATQHPLDRATTHEFPLEPGLGFFVGTSWRECRGRSRIIIENDVWIGCHAILMPGVVVHNGAVIGSGSVVTRDVAPYAIVAGVPATEIRRRFDDETIDRLERIGWWNWPDSTLRSSVEWFQNPISDEVLSALEAVAIR
jgi:acetyltransferase-like isoleucine patch superfamily enzyme